MALNWKYVRESVAWLMLATSCLGTAWGQNTGRSDQTAPDNTRVNDRDKSSTEATADQQKENASDRSLTQQIRKAILQDKSLSAYARNVKVITQDGNVVLKGPVRSVAEKNAVEAKAVALAGEDRVSSQLQVAAK
jgi:hyperosmotically inducible periplasmic protein